MTTNQHSFARESLTAAAIGAGAVALWFLLLDAAEGQPFSTPSVLGQVILFGETEPILSRVVWSGVFAYTAAHFAGFAIFAALVTWLIVLADKNALTLFALLMLFVVFEGFFSGLMALMFARTAGLFPLWKVLAANTLAVAGMGWYLIPRHPGILRPLRRGPQGS